MKKLFLAVCLFLCVKSYSQNSVTDSSLIAYKDSVHGISFEYPAQWDTTLFNRMYQNNNYFGAVFPRDSITIEGSFSFSTFFLGKDMISMQMILENSVYGTKRIHPNATITKQEIFETKRKNKYVHIEAQNVGIETPNMSIKGLMYVEFIFSDSTTIFDFRFLVREDYFDKYKNAIRDVAASFRFDK